MPHILLVMDKDVQQIYGMKGVGKYDEYQTDKVKKDNLLEFKQFEKNSDFLSMFLREFFDVMSRPEVYRLFIVPQSKAVELAAKIQQHIKDKSPSTAQLIKQYELSTDKYRNPITKVEKDLPQKGVQIKQERNQVPKKNRGRKM
ncbi:MAG: hypothetical protein DCE86_00965 [Flavobacteriaceae bacterium]|nr:MAG: hypothetical protein DCE86_00965 [Flavobacteriaceae bacterium]